MSSGLLVDLGTASLPTALPVTVETRLQYSWYHYIVVILASLTPN